MFRSQYLKLLAEAAGISEYRADQMLRYMADLAAAALQDGDFVAIDHFGTFHPAWRRPKKMHNIATGAWEYRQDRPTVKFVPSPHLIKKLRKS